MRRSIKVIIFVLLGFGIILNPSVVLAKKKVIVKYQKKTTHDFDDVVVQGKFEVPQGHYVLKRKALTFNSLLKPREHFRSELEDSVFR
mgnify:CR=1 FL=1